MKDIQLFQEIVYIRSHPAIILDQEVLHNKKLSLKSKGLMAICAAITFPCLGAISFSDIQSLCKEGRDSLYSIVNECIKNGYAIRIRERQSDGKISRVFLWMSDTQRGIQEVIKDIHIANYEGRSNREIIQLNK